MCVFSLQIADQVGELLIHCRYGCKAMLDCPGEYEVAPSGEGGGEDLALIPFTPFCVD